jgi:hypothetical protein
MCKGECVVRREHNNEGFIVAWYAIDNNNYMFRLSGGHHHVFTSLKRKYKRYVTFTLVLRSQTVFGV